MNDRHEAQGLESRLGKKDRRARHNRMIGQESSTGEESRREGKQAWKDMIQQIYLSLRACWKVRNQRALFFFCFLTR